MLREQYAARWLPDDDVARDMAGEDMESESESSAEGTHQ